MGKVNVQYFICVAPGSGNEGCDMPGLMRALCCTGVVGYRVADHSVVLL